MRVDYKETMSKAKEKLKESLLNIKRKKVIPSNKTDLFDKICKSRNELTQELREGEELKSIYCLDNLWEDIETVFNGVKDNKDPESIKKYRKNFKKILDKLQEVGIPFVGDRSICFWSSTFAREQAREYSKNNNAVNDAIAQEYMREIFLGFKDKDDKQQFVFLDLLKNPTPKSPVDFPEIASFFWAVMSEYYAEQIKEGDTVHLFFQDSITVGNFFWNDELLVARSKGARIMLHQFNIKEKTWLDPVNMDDAKKTDEIFLRRREIHPFDNAKDDDLIELGGKKVWKQTYEESNLDKPITAWHAPQEITLPRMKEITQNIRKYKYKLQSDLFTWPTSVEEKKADLLSIKKATVEIIQIFIKKIDVDMRPYYEKAGIQEIKLFSKVDKDLKAAFPDFLKSISAVGKLNFFEMEKNSLSEIATAINTLLIGKKYFSNELREFLQSKVEQLPFFAITLDKTQPFQWDHEVIKKETVAVETQVASL